MRRIFQIGVSMLLLCVVIAPVLEFFDHWDKPGVGADTEFALFALVLLVCLLLAVCKLLSDRAHNTEVELLPLYFSERPPTPQPTLRWTGFEVVPSVSPPLRI